MTRLNHIGIAVRDPETLARVLGLLGLSKTHDENVPDQGVRTHFFPALEGQQDSGYFPQIEILEVLDPEGTVARFIEKRGPGVHHLSFEVKRGELDSLCSKLQAAGVQLIYHEPRPGAHGMRVNFIHPKSSGGVLLEITERGTE
ncbi:MAG: methylmalonyl-CoA epimerase [Bdellovibrionales bacterium]|nr:methylmalonyl-CoA epimerase [Bdellovibrionales bacterium]